MTSYYKEMMDSEPFDLYNGEFLFLENGSYIETCNTANMSSGFCKETIFQHRLFLIATAESLHVIYCWIFFCELVFLHSQE